MALHQTTEPHDQEIEDVYTDGPSQRRLPKYRLPEHSSAPSAAYNLVRDELMLDGNSRQNLATFCTTWVEPEVQKLTADALDKNMIDKDEYPRTAEIENRCVHIIAISGMPPNPGKRSVAPRRVRARPPCSAASL